jgi:hypothetical protein
VTQLDQLFRVPKGCIEDRIAGAPVSFSQVGNASEKGVGESIVERPLTSLGLSRRLWRLNGALNGPKQAPQRPSRFVDHPFSNNRLDGTALLSSQGSAWL